MKTKFFILAVFALLISLDSFSRGSPPPKKPTPVIINGEPGSGVHFAPARNYSFEELEVLAVSEKLSNDLFKSKCFEDFMVKRNLIDTNGLTAIEVVTKLKTSDLTVPVEMYYKNNNVVGYRQPPAPDIFTNRKFHKGATACSRGSNLAHEWSHPLGFTHSFSATRSRPRSVPYSINAAFEVCCQCKKNTVKDCSILP